MAESMKTSASAPQLSGHASSSEQPVAASEDDRVFMVPYRWWRQAQNPSPSSSTGVVEMENDGMASNVVPDIARGIPYTVSAASSSSSYYKILNNILSSDLAFNLRRNDELRQDDEECVLGQRSYALIPVDMWSQARKWHRDCCLTRKGFGSSSFFEDGSLDVYQLTLRISVIRETNIMSVKITKKDNVDNYKRACKIFGSNAGPEQVHIWDFSRQTDLIFMNEWNRSPKDYQRLYNQEILLELQVNELCESVTSRNEGKKNDLLLQNSHNLCFGYCKTFLTNGINGNSVSDLLYNGGSSVYGLRNLGLAGLENLGNTCFMNSAIQCLAHTPNFVDFFHGNYQREINPQNPLGMNGEIAQAFGELLRKLWVPDRNPVAPRAFKTKLARFAPQFNGFNQHDSQELLAFLLDGLHEDLNRVKCKPYVEAKDACGRPDEEVAEEYWENHLARNDSIIVDVCQGQYRSTLVCPICNKVSVTFDPFMYLSLPLPSTAMRSMTVTVFSCDGFTAPVSCTVNVPKYGKSKDLVQALSVACALKDNESLLVAEVYSNRIIRYLEDHSDSISLIRDGDRLAAYRLPKDHEKSPLVVFLHQCADEQFTCGKIPQQWKAFGVPLLERLPDSADGATLRCIFLKLVSPFLLSKDESVDDQENDSSTFSSHYGDTKMDASSSLGGIKETLDEENFPFEFYLTDEKYQVNSRLDLHESISSANLQKPLHVLVQWQNKGMGLYDVRLLSSLPEIYKSSFFSRKPPDYVSLYACLEAFIKEEPLGPEDMWYCPGCKKHQQASKKLDLWRLPEILVIHLKRFSYSRFTKNKLETFVDFPTHDLDLSSYIVRKNNKTSMVYKLYAVSNHYGNMGGGHYTAYVYHEGEERWYDFDDRNVLPITEDSIKTSAAYVLFYRRVQTDVSES